jgi:hypothetical protein
MYAFASLLCRTVHDLMCYRRDRGHDGRAPRRVLRAPDEITDRLVPAQATWRPDAYSGSTARGNERRCLGCDCPFVDEPSVKVTEPHVDSWPAPSPAPWNVTHFPSPAVAALGVLPQAGEGKKLGGQRFFHGGDELLEREGLRQEGVLAVLGQVLLEGIFGIAGDEDDLQVRIAGA